MHSLKFRLVQLFVFATAVIALATLPLLIAATRPGRIIVGLLFLIGVFLALAYVASLVIEGLWNLGGRVARVTQSVMSKETVAATPLHHPTNEGSL